MDPSVLRQQQGEAAVALEEMNHLLNDADAAGRHMTPDEQERYDKLTGHYEQLKASIDRRTKLVELETTSEVTERKTAPPKPTDQPHVRHQNIEVVQSLGSLRGNWGETRTEARTNAYRAGMWALATIYGRRSARDWCVERGIEVRDQAEGANAMGGFLVPIEMEAAVIDFRAKYGKFRANTRVKVMGSDLTVMPKRTTHLTAAFVSEGVAPDVTDTHYTQISLVPKKVMAIIKVSSEVSEDAIINIADDIADDAGYAFAKLEDDCGFIGDGTATYGGIVGIATILSDGVHTAGYHQAATNHDMAEEYTIVDLHGLMAHLPAQAWTNAKWFAHPSVVAGTFMRLLAEAGGNTARDITDRVPTLRYLGMEVVACPSMHAALAASTEVDIILADLQQSSVLGDRRGISMRVDQSVYAATDQLAVICKERFDINNHEMGDVTNAGAAVCLYAH